MNRGDMPAHGNTIDTQTAGYMSEFEGKVTADNLGRWHSGMTIREQMAMAAMQGLCSNSIQGEHRRPSNIAFNAVRLADTLLAVLAETSK